MTQASMNLGEGALGCTKHPAMIRHVFGSSVCVLGFGLPGTYDNISVDNIVGRDVITQSAARLGVKEIFMPNASDASAKIVEADPKLFGKHIETPSGVTIYQGARADGVRLRKAKTAFYVPSADCITFVAQGPYGEVVGAHAGRGSLFDFDHHVRGSKARDHESVVNATLAPWHGQLFRVRAGAFVSIGSANFLHRFDDPVHGKNNEYMARTLRVLYGDNVIALNQDGSGFELGRIDLRALIRSQLRQARVPIERSSVFVTDDIDTFADTDENGPRWHSYRRDRGSGRNGVLVIRLK